MNSKHLRALIKCHEVSWLLRHLNKHLVHWCVNFTVIVIHIYVCVCVCVYMGFSSGSAGKQSACNAEGDPVSIPGLGRSPGEGNGKPLQY